MRYLKGLVLLLVISLTACSEKKDISIEKAAIYFDSISPEKSGLDFSNTLHPKDNLNIIEYLYYYNGGGVAVGDINNDGLDDVYFTANQSPDRLYLNLGDLKFKDITESAGIAIDSTWSSGVTMEDVNNDGLLDIYVSKVGNYKGLKAHNLLYLNKGDETFEEVSKGVGLAFSGFSTQAAFLDYDKDGDMDMYLMNCSIHTPRSYGRVDKRKDKDSLAGDRFFENKLEEGTLSFVDVTEASGIYSSPLGYGLALVTSDINQDGYLDLYVGNDFHENDYLYINQGDKTFKEVGSEWFNHTTRFTMGADIGDLNNDGLQDVFTLDMMPFNHEVFLKSGGEDSDKVSLIKENFGYGLQYARNNFQLNTGHGTFSDIAPMTNTHATDWSWSVLIEDYDNDGLNDLYITNGIYKRPNDLDYINYLSNTNFSDYNQNQANEIEKKLIEQMPTLKLSNIIFRNKGAFEFDRLTTEAGLEPSFSNGSAYSDLDLDGDLDVLVNNINQKAFLLENKSIVDPEHNFIAFDLEDNPRSTTGSKIMVYAKDQVMAKELTVTRGFQSASTRKLHFGLGEVSKIDSILVIWPDNTFQTQKDLAVNEFHKISKKTDLPSFAYSITTASNKLSKFGYRHTENSYLDYERESLIPEKLSVEGPAVVTGDFNGDDLIDIFIGGAKYQSAALYLKDKNGDYQLKKTEPFEKDQVFEDVDAEVFDLENDGDLDLYVISGGNDLMEGNPNLEDRVYLNDGQGNFERLNAVLPMTNGGSISSGDFNSDGFADLFIGSRSMPGVYGLPPTSMILKNTSKGNFEAIASERYGMVTDSQWSDINNDGQLDLIIVGDWMPVTLMINTGNNHFEDQTEKYGLDKTNGMWNTIIIEDLDGNGFKDIIAGNAGLNLKWKASKEKPIKLYIDDFDGNGQPDPLIFYDFFGHYVPFASKDNLMGQLPYLKKRFLSYSDFSKIKGIEDLTGRSEQDIPVLAEIHELRSMVYLNDGFSFKGIALPKEAQMSSIEDILLDMEGTQRQLYFVGNYMDYVNELGRSDANPGGVLTDFNGTDFKGYHSLGLPKDLSARKLIKLGDKKFLVIANNDDALVIDLQ